MKPVLTIVSFSDETGVYYEKKLISFVSFDAKPSDAIDHVQNRIEHEETRNSLQTNTLWGGEIVSSKFL